MGLSGTGFSLLLALMTTSLHATDDWGDDAWADEDEQEIQLHGFYELAAGGRIHDDSAIEDDLTLAELRARIESETHYDDMRFSGKADLYADAVEGGIHFNLREALVDLSLGSHMDVRGGHQVLTWGTGDLVFLNDLFAKDWQSFFSGRDDEYLKAPSTSIKFSYYGDKANLDFVWTPVFTNDNFIEGERFSYFSPMSGEQMAAPEGKLSVEYPDKTFSEGEFAARLHGRTQLFGESSAEWAVYAYRGFWKQPNAVNDKGRAFFSPMNSFGASLRSNVASGIGYAEFSLYNSEDDKGDDPMLPNNQSRFLLGYEQELRPKLTMGMQYYLEHIQDYSALIKTDQESPYRPDENRELWTLRLTYRMMQDNLILNWFSFYSPTDQDYYHRPSLKYRFNDELSLTMGGNLFGGQQRHTFFGQFENASNLYARLRFSY